jgi:hypothetical protein
MEMITWFKGLPLLSKFAAGGVLLVLVLLIVLNVRGCAKDERAENNEFVNVGVTKERAQTQGKVIDNVGKANDARDRPTPAAERGVCEKYDRNCAPNG